MSKVTPASAHRARRLRETNKATPVTDQAAVKAKRQRQYELAEKSRAYAMAQGKKAGRAYWPWSPLSPRGRWLVLRKLGFASYKEYIGSKLWRKIRAGVLEAFDTCECGEKATEAHHECYTENNLAGKSREWLVGICAKCHPAADREMRDRWYPKSRRYLCSA